MSSSGIIAGLATAILWAATAVCFEAAGRRVGSLVVNVLRLAVAQALFIGLSVVRSGHALPPDLSPAAWWLLSLSGVVGFVGGDLLLFRSFLLIGARLAMLVYASVPAMTALAGLVFLDERLGAFAVLGIGVTTAGIALAVAGKPGAREAAISPRTRRWGILLALGASLGQTAGLLLAKHGSSGVDSFAATQVRVISGLTGFLIVAAVARELRRMARVVQRGLTSAPTPALVAEHASARTALLTLSLGALLGPFLGVSLGLLSTQLLAAGVASTLMSLVPVLLVPASIVVFHERPSRAELAGTALAFAGVAILTLL